MSDDFYKDNKDFERVFNETIEALNLLYVVELIGKVYHHKSCSPELKSFIKSKLKKVYADKEIRDILERGLTTLNPSPEPLRQKYFYYPNNRGDLIFGFYCRNCRAKNEHMDERKDKHRCLECRSWNYLEPVPDRDKVE